MTKTINCVELVTPEQRFQYAVEIVLLHEGGLSEDKRDPGGTTQWGVSLRFLKAAGIDIDGDGDIDSHDIRDLTRGGSKEIYRDHWWNNFGYDRLNSIRVSTKVFDLSINMGPTAAHRLLQIAVNRLSDKPISVDGIIGPNTFKAANEKDAHVLRQTLRDCAEHKYVQILADKPHMEWARNGWIRRSRW